MKFSNLLLACLMIVFLSACSYPGAIFVEEVQVGLDVSVSTTDTRPLNVNLGYDQSLFAMAPKKEKGKEAISLLSKSDLFIQFTDESIIQNIFVSGHAAKNIAKDKDSMKALFQLNDINFPETGNSE